MGKMYAVRSSERLNSQEVTSSVQPLGSCFAPEGLYYF